MTSMTERKYKLTTEEARKVHRLVNSHCNALHNWIASAIERGDIGSARDMVEELREFEKLYAKTNVHTHEMLDKMKVEA